MEKRKLDRRLVEEVERRKTNGSKESLHVVIRCRAEIYTPQRLTGSALGSHVEREVKEIQGPVMKELKKLGIRSSAMKSVPLSNCIEAHVSISQLTEIEALELVASIRLSSLDRVAL